MGQETQQVARYRLSPPQQRLWSLARRHGAAPFAARCLLRVTGRLDAGRLRRAFDEAVARHEVLRTRYEGGGRLRVAVQVVEPEGGCEFVYEAESSSVRAAEEYERAGGVGAGTGLRVWCGEVGVGEHEAVVSVGGLSCDAAGLAGLVREAARRYAEAAGVGSVEAEEAEEPAQYADLSEWLNEMLEGEETHSQRAYWREQDFSGLDSLRLPFEAARAGGEAFRPRQLASAVAAETVARLEEVARESQVPASVLLLTCWQLLLHRLTGRTEVIVGASYDGRMYAELENVPGLFNKYLPIRVRFEDGLTFSELSRRVHEQVNEVYDWQEYFSLEQVCPPAGDEGEPPLFPACYEFDDDASEFTAGGVTFSVRAQDACIDAFGVKLRCSAAGGSLVTEFHYDAGRFAAEDVGRVGRYFHKLLGSALATPERRARDLEFIDDAERRQLLVEFNDTRVELPGRRCVQHLFEEQAARTPDADALAFEGVRFSYAELNARANRLAHRLRGEGVRPDTPVGILMERSPEVIIGLLAVLKSGAAYVPLDEKLPQERLSFMVEDAGLSVVLTRRDVAAKLPEGTKRIVVDASEDVSASDASAENPAAVAGLGNLAYVIYTSGSTGRPKGVAIEHRQLFNYVRGIVSRLGIPVGASFALVSTFAADLGNTVIFPALCTGGCLHVISDERATSPALLEEYFSRNPVDCLKIVPTHLEALLAGPNPERILPRGLLVLGGDVSRFRWVEELQRRAPGCRIFNHYGPTETTIGSLTYLYTQDSQETGSGTLPVGRPIANTTVYVLDGRMNPLPSGLPGELYIGGDGLARGYLGRPGLTAERFVPDPFSSEAGARLYRTGDLVRYLTGGELEFLGRADQQVKVRGYRIELGEIEAALAAHASVRECVAAVAPGVDGDTQGAARLVAYYTSSASPSPSAAELRAHLAERLPDYMVPSALMELERLPLTANGKLDRRALPVALAAASPDGGGYVEPRGRVQRLIAEVWGQVLGRERVGATENFFELGGDSILGIQVVARLSRRGLRLTPRQLFRHQTVAELAEAAAEGAQPFGDAGEEPEEVEGEAALTPIQRRFFEEFPAGESHWNQAVLLRARAGLNLPALATALAAVERRHEALRLRFERAEGGEWRQRVVKWDGAAPLTSIDLKGLPTHARREALERAATEAQAGLEIGRGPLWRAVHFHLGEESEGEAEGERLLLVIHHLGVDGVSWRVLLDDLRAAYEQALAGEPISLGAKTTSFKRWARELERYAANVELAREGEYWLGVSEGCAPPTVPAAGGASLVREAEALTAGLTPGETAGLLRRAGREGSGAINELLLAALAEALCEPGRDVLVEVEGHGREDLFEGVDLTRTVGWFTSLYPVSVRRGRGADETLELVRESVRGVPGGGLGYGILRHVSAGEAGEALRGLPHAQVSFNYLGQLDQVLGGGGPWEAAGESAGAARSPESRRWHEVEVTAAVTGGRLWAEWMCGRDAAEGVRGAAERFVAALRALAAEVEEAAAGALEQAGRGALPAGVDEGEGVRRGESWESEEEASYELTPMQQGMLFHSLYTSDASVYVVQKSYTLRGEVDASALRRAWEGVVHRHPALRTRFDWQTEADPRQVVVRSVRLPWREEDWRGGGEGERRAGLEEFLREERRAGFDLGRAPLMRLSLLHLSDEVYQLVFTHHQLLLDGWSAVLVLREVSELYAAYGRGAEPRLAPPPRPYADYVSWLRGRDLSEAERFWRAELAGVRPTLLGRGGARAGGGAEGGAVGRAEHYNEARARLGAGEAESLRGWARRERVTLNTAVQGAWGLVLGRESGQGEAVFGSVVSGRPAELAGVEAMVGLFINTLPVRVRGWGGGAEGEGVGGWLRGLQGRQAEARQYEWAPLWEVQAWAGAGGGGLFDSILVFENYPADERAAVGEAKVGVEDVRFFELTNYPLAIAVGPGEDLSFNAVYDERQFDGATVARMLEQLRALLLNMASGAAANVNDLFAVSEAERHLLLEEWNAVGEPAPDATLHRMFERQAALHPDAVAVSFRGECLTYAELNRRANQTAHMLRELGAEPGQALAVMLDSGPAQVVALMGILKAGCAFVFLDPDYPPGRLQQILGEVAPPVLLTDEACVGRHRLMLQKHLRESDCRVAVTGGAAQSGEGFAAMLGTAVKLDDYSADDPCVEVGPAAAAYVVYTSGSTGRPKGIVQSHRSFAQFVGWQSRQFGLGPSKRIALWASITYDASYCDILSALCFGATLCVETAEVRHDAAATLRWLAEEKVSALILVPSYFRQLLDALEAGGAGPRALPDLEWVGLAGEVLPPDLAERWLSRFPGGAKLLNLYGPTESVLATFYPVERVEPGRLSIPVGRAIEGRHLLILDRAQRLCPVGVRGEIYIRSPYLTDGYFKRPEETARAFIQNPLHDEYPDRVYRTGDVGRYLPDGNIEYFGRLDNQVKIRGVRVEPEEVESALMRHAAVTACVVSAQEFGGDRRLVAYVAGSGDLSPKALRGFLRESLPEQMIPSRFVLLEELPRLPNGKVDRRALEAADTRGTAAEGEFVAPRTPLEQTVAGVWRELLGVEQVGVNDNFFELGGHSLLAGRLVNRLRKLCFVNLPLRTVFERPTVAGVAAAVAKLQAAGEAGAGRLSESVERLKHLSDEEIDALLAEKGAGGA